MRHGNSNGATEIKRNIASLSQIYRYIQDTLAIMPGTESHKYNKLWAFGRETPAAHPN